MIRNLLDKWWFRLVRCRTGKWCDSCDGVFFAEKRECVKCPYCGGDA